MDNDAADGTLVLRSTGIARGSGVTVDSTFTLRQPTAGTLSGSVTGAYRFMTSHDRSTFSGALTSGNRVP